jgi:hypothetical protein
VCASAAQVAKIWSSNGGCWSDTIANKRERWWFFSGW